ncbi:Hypothetical predicted protein [Cloeon dipterum]|nr:Hypothetical predicted protein [Cloeon dipterum]
MTALRPPFPGSPGPRVNAAQSVYQFTARQSQQNPRAAGDCWRRVGHNVDNLRGAQQRSAVRRLQGVIPAVRYAEESQPSRHHYPDTAPAAFSGWAQFNALSGQSYSGYGSPVPHHFQGGFHPQSSGQQTASTVPSHYTRADYRSPGPSGAKPPAECPSRPPIVHKPIIESGSRASRSHPPPRQPRTNQGSTAQARHAKRRRNNTAQSSQAASSSSASPAAQSAHAAPSSATSSAAQLASSSSASVPGRPSLDPSFLEVRSAHTNRAIRDLRRGAACSNCTMRFTAAQKKDNEYALHLDAHFRENRRLKENILTRGWFATRNEWCGEEKILAITERVQTTKSVVEEELELPTLPARNESQYCKRHNGGRQYLSPSVPPKQMIYLILRVLVASVENFGFDRGRGKLHANDENESRWVYRALLHKLAHCDREQRRTLEESNGSCGVHCVMRGTARGRIFDSSQQS